MYLCALAQIFFASGCDSDSSDNSILTELALNQQKWESLNAVDYQFESALSCECLDAVAAPRLILVEGNEIRSAANLITSERIDTDVILTHTINELFQLIAIEETQADSLSVDYDPETGVPRRISVDVDSQAADDEYIITTSNLLILTDDIVCTDQFVFGLSLTVVDESTQEVLTCETTVTAQEGDFFETQVPDDTGTCEVISSISMLGERAGVYQINVERQGYETVIIDDFGIAEDFCHVIPRSLTVEMAPLN